jgi:hypothetical protein
MNSSSLSRSGTPSLNSSSSSSANEGDDDLMDLDDDDYEATYNRAHCVSDIDCDDYDREDVTPSSTLHSSIIPISSPTAADAALSPFPPPHHLVRRHHRHRRVFDPASMSLDKASALRYSHIELKDAMLLLSFHWQEH